MLAMDYRGPYRVRAIQKLEPTAERPRRRQRWSGISHGRRGRPACSSARECRGAPLHRAVRTDRRVWKDVPAARNQRWIAPDSLPLQKNDLQHWLLPLLANRVDVFEAQASDVANGHVPNLCRDRGGPTALRHYPAGIARKGLVFAGVAAVALLESEALFCTLGCIA